MAKKLKVFQASLGFYDEAIAAPSMKAALDVWGAKSNLFHQGVAKESSDPDVVAAAMSKPGVILRRPVGSNDPFREHAALPTNISDRKAGPNSRSVGPKAKKKKAPAKAKDAAATRQAARAFEQEKKRRARERRKEEADQEREQARRRQAIEKAQTALKKAEREHERKAGIIEAERTSLDERSQREEQRWEAERKKLMSALSRARD
jgi:colicin import membrane protein